MNGAGTSAGPTGKHPAWCAVDVLPPGGQWHCCSGHAVVELSLRRPDGAGDGAAPDKLSVFLAQGPYDIRPRLWLALGDVDRDGRADAAELTVGEARQLVKALTEAVALAAPAGRGETAGHSGTARRGRPGRPGGHGPFVVVPDAPLWRR